MGPREMYIQIPQLHNYYNMDNFLPGSASLVDSVDSMYSFRFILIGINLVGFISLDSLDAILHVTNQLLPIQFTPIN